MECELGVNGAASPAHGRRVTANGKSGGRRYGERCGPRETLEALPLLTGSQAHRHSFIVSAYTCICTFKVRSARSWIWRVCKLQPQLAAMSGGGDSGPSEAGRKPTLLRIKRRRGEAVTEEISEA